MMVVRRPCCTSVFWAKAQPAGLPVYSGCSDSPRRPDWQSPAPGRPPQCGLRGLLPPPASRGHRCGRYCRMPPQGPAWPVPADGHTSAPCFQKRRRYSKSHGSDRSRCGRCGRSWDTGLPARCCPPRPVFLPAAERLPPRGVPVFPPPAARQPFYRNLFVSWSFLKRPGPDG